MSWVLSHKVAFEAEHSKESKYSTVRKAVPHGMVHKVRPYAMYMDDHDIGDVQRRMG